MEAQNNSCASHNDCYTGQYCWASETKGYTKGACSPCEYVTLVHGEYDQKTGEYDQNDDDDGSPHEFLIKPLDDDEGRFLDRHWN